MIIVTIGEHHHGPHVDALKALAERCGAIVALEPANLPLPTVKVFRRIPYAGCCKRSLIGVASVDKIRKPVPII